MKKTVQELKKLSIGTWIVLCLFFLLLFDMGGYYLAVLTGNSIRPFYIMEQIAPFIKGVTEGHVDVNRRN